MAFEWLEMEKKLSVKVSHHVLNDYSLWCFSFCDNSFIGCDQTTFWNMMSDRCDWNLFSIATKRHPIKVHPPNQTQQHYYCVRV